MENNKTRIRTVRGKKYPDYDKQDMDILAAARRWLNAKAGMHEQSQFTEEESQRRVAYYAAQIEAEGQITRWLGPAAPKPKSRYRTRFAFGDARGRHAAACTA